MHPTTTSHRDPVCGMAVDPSTAKYSHTHESTTWYFCADSCREQFVDHPNEYLKQHMSEANVAPRGKVSWPREVLVWISVFSAVVFVTVAARGFTKEAVNVQPNTKIIGSAAGSHRAIDSGQGGVLTEVTHDQKAGALEFIVSLNTHTVDLTNFDPSTQVRLHVAGQEYAPRSAVGTGEKSSHHQNYQLSFPPVNDTNVAVVVHDVGGIEQRELPFRL